MLGYIHHTGGRRVGYGGKDTLVNVVLEEWWRQGLATLILIEGVLEWKFGKLILHQDLIIDFCNNFYFQSFLIGSKTLKIKVVATCKNQLSTLVQNEFPKISTLRSLFSMSKWDLSCRPDLVSTILFSG